MFSLNDDDERKKREAEFDRMFGSNNISSDDYTQRANEFDSVFGHIKNSNSMDTPINTGNNLSEVEKNKALGIDENFTNEYSEFLNGMDDRAKRYFYESMTAKPQENNINTLDTTKSSKGNIDLNNRPVVKNDDGSISTVRSISFEEDGKEVLIPTIINGKIVSDKEAIEHYHKTGEYLGKFNSVEEANAYAEQLHNQQEQIYANNENNKKKFEIFKGSKAFDDGYQFGDITKTIAGTATDLATNLGSGFGAVYENIVDLGAHAVATIQALTGHEESSKKTRDWADKDVIKEQLKSNPYSSPIGSFYGLLKGNGTYWDNLQRQKVQKIIEKQNNGEELTSYEKSHLDLFKNLYPEIENQTSVNYEDDSVLGDTSDQVAELIGYTGGLAVGTYLLGGAGNISIAIGSHTLNLPTLAIVGGASGGLKEADSKGENVSERERWSKAISSGLIEGTTEGIFGMFGVGGNEWTDILGAKAARKMSTGAGKILAKLGVQSTGEATEEFLSYLGNYIVDNGLIDKLGDTDFSSKWDWGEVGEQAALAFVSSAISLGGESYINTNQSIKVAEEQLERKLTKQEKVSVIKAITEDALIKSENRELFEDGEESVGNYFVASYNENGEVGEVVETLGKAINNPNEKLNIEPVIIKDQQNKTFNVIDGQTGILLDTTPYTSVQEAVDGFTEIISNMSDAQIERVNNNVADSTLALYAEIGKIIQERQSQNIPPQNQQNNITEEKNISTKEINNQENKMSQNGFSEQINDNSISTENKSFEDIAYEAMQNTETQEVESPLQNRNIETIGKQTDVKAYQYENPEVKPYFQEMAKMIGEDLSYISSSENRSSVKGGGTKLNARTKALTTLHTEMGYSYDQIAKGLQNIIEDNGKENNAISKKLELIIDDQLRNGYTNALGKIIEPNQDYIDTIINNNNANVSTISAYNGTITAKKTIANKNNVQQSKEIFKNKNLTKEQIRDIVKYNQDGKEIKDSNYIDFMVERYIDNINISNVETDTINTNLLLKDTYEKAREIVTDNDEKKIRNKQQELIIDEVYKQIQDTKFKTSKKLLNENNQLETILIDLQITKNGIKESLHKGMSIEKISIIPFLDDLIKTANDGVIRNENKERTNLKWYYLYNTAMINDELYGVKIDIRKTPQGDRFYVHRVNLINKKGTVSQIPSNESATIKTNQAPLINNSISQKKQNVKGDKTIINKDMQKSENNTKIQDFGEKIGGARKDLVQPRTATKQTKEVIHDYTIKNTNNGYSVDFKGKTLQDGFKTQKEAEEYILAFKDNVKSHLATVEKSHLSNEYIIKILNPRTLKASYTNKKFSNLQDAESYAMALSIYLKENGKNLFRPQIQKVTRENQNNKNATKTTGENILNDFGFKGGEFGNWVTQNERQQFLNYAQDAFTDLATALDILPSDLGQNGDMSIAFGARGKGLTGAVAHFEPGKKVINMTRLKGAGSLAHEYGHSIDNWLSRLSGYDKDGMATTNAIARGRLSENLKKAVNEVTDAINYNVSTNQEEVEKKNAIYEKQRISSLEEYHLKDVDRIFDGKATTYKYNRTTKKHEQVPIKVTEEQQHKYQEIRKILIEGKLKDTRNFDYSSLSSSKVEYDKPLEDLRKLYKEVVGRKLNDDTVYGIYSRGKALKQVTEVKTESAYRKSAVELDKMMGRSTLYYSKIEEMWARAFEAYVSDKLKAKGITDTYLVHSVNNSDYALFNPFPAGEERQNINKAFDKLIQTMKDENILHDNKYTKPNDSTINTDDGIRYLKKSGNKKTNNQIVTDNQGRQLSKEQQEYFKDSKVRDESGNLLTMYHGTMANFSVFDIKKAGINYENNWSALGRGFYFTPNYNAAKEFATAGTTGKTKNIKEVYINIVNPFEINKDYTQELSHLKKEYNVDDFTLRKGYRLIQVLNENNYDSTKILKKLGFDGVIESYNNEIDQVVAFNSNQIKNIDNSSPTLNEDIRFMKKNSINSYNNTIPQDKQKNIKINNESKEKPYQTNGERADAWIEQEIKKVEETGNWDNTIPVTSLTDIRNTIEDYLGLGIKKGKFRQSAYALYKSTRDVIRTKEYKDIDSILHETGHALDLGNRLNLDKESIADELLNAVSKLEGYEDESRTVKLEEGFAEVIREYSIVPEQAKADYPQSVAVLEQIRKADKSFNDFITKVQQQTYNYIHQNPQNRVHSNISIGQQTDKPQMSKAWIEQEVMRNIWDKDYAVKKVVNEFAKIGGKTTNQVKASNNAYYLTRLASGIGDKVTSMLADGYINEKGDKLMPGLNKVGEILGDDPQRYNDLRDFLVARRDTDYKAKTLKTGIRDMDTKYVLEKFANDKQIKEASQVIYDTLDGVMQYAVDNGLISQDDVKKLKESNAFYVPMQRVIEGRGNQVGKKGAVKDLFKRRTGSELDIKDVLENIVANSSNIIQQVENNNILKALYNQGEEAGLTGAIYDVIDTPMAKVGTANLSMWENELKKQGVNTSDLDLEKTIDIFAPNNKVDTEKLITSFINEDGKRVYLQFNDKILFNSLMNLDGKIMSNVLKINSKLNMPLRYGATMANLGFAIPNMISDTAQAAIFLNAGFVPLIDNALGVLDVLTATNKHIKTFVKNFSPEYVKRIENMYTIYKQTGATSSTRMSQFRDSTQSNMKNIYGTKNSEVLGIDEKWKPLKRLLDILTNIPEVSEQTTRFRGFEKSIEMYRRKGYSETDARILAALESRDATQDFGRTGNFTREINQLIPFSAARVGSSYTFAEKVKANPKQTMMRIALLSAIAMAIKAIGYRDKEIQELNQRKKDDNFVLKVGDNVVTIKKPQGLLRSIVNLTEYIQDLATSHIEEGKAGERLGEWFKNTIADNMPADNILAALGSSSFFGGIAEYIANKDFYYNTDIVKSYDLDLPDYMQYYEYNSQLAILLGRIFNQSPAKIDNLISSWFGGLGTQLTGIMDYTSGKLGITTQKPEMGAESNAVGKRFIVNVNSNSASVDEIYNRKTELTKKKNGGNITQNEETELSTITDAVSNMSKVNKQIREIKQDLKLSGKEKAEQIRVLQQQRTDIARQALGKDMIHSENSSAIELTSFYPTTSSLSLNNRQLELTSDMKKEYAELASNYYSRYERQGLYNTEKLKQIKTKAKEYAKKTLMQKYRSQLVRSK